MVHRNRGQSFDKFTKQSEGYKLLLRLFSEGIINGSETPKSVYDAHSTFSQYKRDAFRNNFRQLKNQFSAGLLNVEGT